MTGFDYKQFIRTLVQQPGVYKMLDHKNQVIYVGKAKNLKLRVSSYFRSNPSPKIKRLVAAINAIEITVTNTEIEALLLENALIKRLQPRYNVLLRDDKSYPYLYLATQHPFPSISLHRGAKKTQGRHFGPYHSVTTAKNTLKLVQNLFQVRQCNEIWYRNRSRPCLQYQIQRCTGPCVGLVGAEHYAEQVANSILFLEGRANQIIDNLVHNMELAAAKLEYEQAAKLRDQIVDLRRIYTRQHIAGEKGDLDILALVIDNNIACIQIIEVRDGHVLGTKNFQPRLPNYESDHDTVLYAFILQYYLEHTIPTEILANYLPVDLPVLIEVLSHHAGYTVNIHNKPKGERKHWLKMAIDNAKIAVQSQVTSHQNYVTQLENLRQILQLKFTPNRLECFDISHTSGERPVASCVVFDQNGPRTADYRRFNIENITGGDDYAALTQALTRHYHRIISGEFPLPDVLCIDGGRGQLTQALTVLHNLDIQGPVLMAITKGEGRKPSLDQLWVAGHKAPLDLSQHVSALHLIQQLRDEAHRFAITGHRRQRSKARRNSILEDIPGIGNKRRRLLINQFGGLQELLKASVEDITQITGIGKALAQKIYAHLHG
ncbi:excinuclease ABC subunit C [Achromatium sp. WMS2]|nr:excinuclease ABC subunit C [Achromatium sp. WMS2]